MITIIIGTNRHSNLSQYIGKKYQQIIENEYDVNSQILSLESMPSEVLNHKMYDDVHPWIDDIDNEYFAGADKFIFIIPEYNGSFPGILKLFIDLLTLKNNGQSLKWKKAALIGVSSGRFGNWLGIDQFQSVLNYLKVNTYAYKFSIPEINEIIGSSKEIDGSNLADLIKKHIDGFIKF